MHGQGCNILLKLFFYFPKSTVFEFTAIFILMYPKFQGIYANRESL